MENKNNNFTIMKDLSGYFKEGERKAIYNSADNPRDKVLIRLLWVTGRRINEILNIKIHDIDFEINAITIHVEKKSRKVRDKEGNYINIDGRYIRERVDKKSFSYIDEPTIKILKYFIYTNHLLNDDYLFKSDYTESNKPITRQRAFKIIRRTCEKAGIESVGGKKPHPHHFRHTFAVDNAKKMKSPSDVRKLQIMLDHSSLAVTEEYLKFNEQDIKDMLGNVGD